MKPCYKSLIIVTLVVASILNARAAERSPFIVDVSSEPKTIGDIKPPFVNFTRQERPKISIRAVLKGYRKLFDNTVVPEVQIDALNRINALESRFGIQGEKRVADEIKQNKKALAAYEKIVESGVFYQRMDELLYQTAKAYDLIGELPNSLKSLKMLAALYPNSRLIDEVQFRIAEAYFDLGAYQDAADQYEKVIRLSAANTYQGKARFKLAWSQFKLNKLRAAGLTSVAVLDQYPELAKNYGLNLLSPQDHEIVSDSLRLLSIIFAQESGNKGIESLQSDLHHKRYAYMFYDGLAKFYLKQQRFEDSALISQAYIKNYRDDFASHLLAVNAVEAYRKGRFPAREWQAKEEFVAHYGLKGYQWQSWDESHRAVIRPTLLSYLSELSHLYYTRMQKTVKSDEKEKFAVKAANYYLQSVAVTPDTRERGQNLFLAADALSTAGKYEKAIRIYEKSAYESGAHKNNRVAGYAAITAYDHLKRNGHNLTPLLRAKRQKSIEAFASHFVNDPKTPLILNDLANEKFKQKNYEEAESLSARVLKYTGTRRQVLYSSYLVNGHSNFALENYAKAEIAYQHALGFNKLSKKDRTVLVQRLAASVYKQADQASAQGDLVSASKLYLKVANASYASDLKPKALYDAATLQLKAKNYSQAIDSLTRFRNRYPEHELNTTIPEKLVYAYSKTGDWTRAAVQLVSISKAEGKSKKAQDSLYQAAQFYEKAGNEKRSFQTYQAFSQRFSQAFDLAIEAKQKVIEHYLLKGNAKKVRMARQDLIQYEGRDESRRNARSKFLAATASFALAQEMYPAYQNTRLKIPLKKSLKRKKLLLKSLVSQYQHAGAYGVQEITTAVTFKLGELYRQLAKDLMKSERPKGLDELQLEQYDILLEEQAFPFEEKAIELFRVNTARAKQGIYDSWIRQSFSALEKMLPAAFKRNPRRADYAPEIL